MKNQTNLNRLALLLLAVPICLVNGLSDPTAIDGGPQFGGLIQHKPGMKVRVTQALSDLVKDNLLQYGVAYLNFDLQLPKEGVYSISSFPIYTDVHYSNVEYSPLQLDISKATLNYTHMSIDDEPVVYMELPMIKKWKLAFDYMYTYLFTYDGRFKFAFKNMSATATSTLKATADGHIFPHLHDLKINIADARLNHDDWFAEFMYRQLFNLGKYIIQSAYNMFGASIVNRNLFEMSKVALNDQLQPFKLEIPQLKKSGDFLLNWRLTANPEIHNHELDFSFFADIGPKTHHCLVPPDQHDYYFQNNYKSKYLQFIMSDRVPNCVMEAMERQEWFKFEVDTNWIVHHFGTHKVRVNAALLKRFYPQIAEQYGDNQELILEIEFVQPRVNFGATERHLQTNVQMKFGVKLKGQFTYIVFDEFDIIAEADIEIDQEVLVGNVWSLIIEKSKHSDTNRVIPVYDTLGITADSYKTFWIEVAKEERRWKNLFNKILSSGVPLPYWNLEFLTKFTFHPHAVIVVMDVFYNNVELFKH